MSEIPALDAWTKALVAELELPLDSAQAVPGVLDMTKVVAHQVARPAAPVSAFLAGLAAGQAGGGADQIKAALDTAAQLASGWTADQA